MSTLSIPLTSKNRRIPPPSCPEHTRILSLPNPCPLSDPHRFNLKDKQREDDSLLSPEIPLRLQLPAHMGCQNHVRTAIRRAVKTPPDPQPSLPLHTMARTATITAEDPQRITFPPIPNTPNNLIYRPTSVQDPHDRPRLPGNNIRPCILKMTLNPPTDGRIKRRCQGSTQLVRLFLQRFPHSPS